MRGNDYTQEFVARLSPDEMQTLRILWDAANLNPSYHMLLVQDGDRLYRVILQVPGVSWSEPE